ncbi:Y4bD/Y4pK family protein [Streptomyces sp. NPDC096311]|uniref:Y4bD/Y4pK family protein n=1 Tax=Streptomyces sp. NPDC096311 TaxID=3366083 RepID=UPI0037F2B961
MTHPFHPLSGQELEFIERRQCWRGDRVYYFDEVGGRSKIPAEWTSVAPVDPFVVAAAGECPFRTQDLVALATLIDRLRGVGEITP